MEANVFTGKVIKHSKKFHLPIPDVSTGVEVGVLWQTTGKKDWHQRRHYPTIGLSMAYTNYGIDSVYGRCISLFPTLTIPVITGNRLEWTIRIGDGIGYVTHKYGRIPLSDTLNNAIGSHINDYASFNSDIRYHFNTHWEAQAGINFSHISDASYHQPNLGINLIGYHAGIRYFPVGSRPQRQVRTLPRLRNRTLFQLRGGLAFTQSEAPGGPSYPVYLGTALVSRRYRSKNKVFAGVDYSYHESIAAFLRNNLIEPGHERRFASKSAILVGDEFLMGRLGLVLQMGYYIHQAYLMQDPYYQKLGANYYLLQREKGIVKEFCLSGYLKTHKSIAELAEFGMGISF